ncbi:MAG: TPR domain protein, putative component of TonB system, partial [uncultured Rubrobacteraceae bacterium]
PEAHHARRLRACQRRSPAAGGSARQRLLGRVRGIPGRGAAAGRPGDRPVPGRSGGADQRAQARRDRQDPCRARAPQRNDPSGGQGLGARLSKGRGCKQRRSRREGRALQHEGEGRPARRRPYDTQRTRRRYVGGGGDPAAGEGGGYSWRM